MDLRPQYNDWFWPFNSQYRLIEEMNKDNVLYGEWYRAGAQCVLIAIWAIPLMLILTVAVLFSRLPFVAFAPLAVSFICYLFSVAVVKLIFPKLRQYAATRKEALAARDQLDEKFKTQEPWKNSFMGSGIGRNGTSYYVSIWLYCEVPEGTYPTEHNGVQVRIRVEGVPHLRGK